MILVTLLRVQLLTLSHMSVIKALVRAFLPADELHNLHIKGRTWNVFINFFDDEVGFSEVVEAKTAFLMALMFDETRKSFHFSFHISKLLRSFSMTQGSLAHDFWCGAVTFGKLTSEKSSHSGFVVESFFHLSHLCGHEGLHHGHLHLEQVGCGGIDTIRDGNLGDVQYVGCHILLPPLAPPMSSTLSS